MSRLPGMFFSDITASRDQTTNPCTPSRVGLCLKGPDSLWSLSACHLNFSSEIKELRIRIHAEVVILSAAFRVSDFLHDIYFLLLLLLLPYHHHHHHHHHPNHHAMV
jgi:hypothetical protein